jgi:hypothetical protein
MIKDDDFKKDDYSDEEFCIQHLNKKGLKPISKIERYNWKLYDSPGELMYIDKKVLYIDQRYQRNSNSKRVLSIASNWKWMSCGTILVADRKGLYYVVDGQHRVLAANKREDISNLPCLVFKAESIEIEADAWINANTNRKIPTSYERFGAQITRRDEDALYLLETCDKLKIIISKDAKGPMQLKSTRAALTVLNRNRHQFDVLIN